MFGLGMQELIVIFLVVFLLFGAKSLPEIAKGLGKGIKEFRNALRSMNDDVVETKEDKSKDSITKNV
ncbi:MAG TPA: twin-arginine translocase TatA/TatE family subunit [Candidatus Omnitrophota bacterium]|nr:twin-arginine translocase TatA/TatE family subunit [Candidatus Omnitrophota bacterium]